MWVTQKGAQCIVSGDKSRHVAPLGEKGRGDKGDKDKGRNRQGHRHAEHAQGGGGEGSGADARRESVLIAFINIDERLEVINSMIGDYR